MATNIDTTTRTTRETAEAQSDAYEALAENLAAVQRRSIGLVNEGLRFVRLQEDNARATQEWFANGVKLLRHQQRNAEFVGNWTSHALEALREQTGHNVRATEAFARGVRKQQESLQALSQVWGGAYRDFFSPFTYAQGSLRTVERATQQVAQQGIRVAEEATAQTEEMIRQTRKLEGLSAEQFEKVLSAQVAANAELKRQAEALRSS